MPTPCNDQALVPPPTRTAQELGKRTSTERFFRRIFLCDVLRSSVTGQLSPRRSLSPIPLPLW